MEIYQEPVVNVVAAHQPGPSSRCVSFVTATTTSTMTPPDSTNRHRGMRKQPLSRHNPNTTPTTVAATATAAATAASRAGVHPNRPKTPNGGTTLKKSYAKTPIPTSSSLKRTLVEKENRPPSTATTTTMTSVASPPPPVSSAGTAVTRRSTRPTTPNSAQAFRRALKGASSMVVAVADTVIIKPSKLGAMAGPGRRVGGGGGGGLGPPQRMKAVPVPVPVPNTAATTAAPKTPTSFLRTEFFDDSMDSMNDESLLVSPPPGALWNVLGAKSASSSQAASRTKLVMVSPHAASAIHRLATSQKKARQKQEQRQQEQQQQQLSSWTSPPLQPRSLLITTPPETEQEEEIVFQIVDGEDDKDMEEEDDTVMMVEGRRRSPEQWMAEASLTTKSKSTTPPGIAMDLSSMFSNEKNKETTSKVFPPPALLKRLQTPTGTARRSSSRRQATATNDNEQQQEQEQQHLASPDGRLSPSIRIVNPMAGQAKPVVDVVVEVAPVLGGSGVITMATKDVPLLLERLEQRQDEAMASSLVATENSDPPQAASLLLEAAVVEPASEVVAESRGKGLTMDMSRLFGTPLATMLTTTTSQVMAKPTPPPHLLERLSQRTSRINKNNRGKENTKPLGATKSTGPPIMRRPVKANKSTAEKVTANMMTVAPIVPSKSKPTTNTSKKIESKQKKTVSTKPTKTKYVSDISEIRLAKKAFAAKQVAANASINTSTLISTSEPEHRSKSGIAFDASAPTELSTTIVPKTPATSKKQRRVTTSQAMSSPVRRIRETDDWAGKQCDTFVSWLNYTFCPNDEEYSGTSGLRALVIHRRLAHVRFRASELFQGPSMRRTRNLVQAEIARGRLAMRNDRDIYADLSLRKQATQLLLSYTTPWLRLGLEVMFGECILPDHQLNSNCSDSMTPVARMRTTLRKFVVERVLTDDNVLMKYTKGRTKVPSGKFEKLYREEMRTLVLYRLMVLILFLDKLKKEHVLDKVPRLFTKASEVKSSKAVLLAVCRDFLSSEGDFMKHLSRIGLKVSYVQDPIDELEFSVSNLAADLRDGGRLTRLAEIVTDAPFKSTMRGLRLPAISRLQKMHNVQLAFRNLKEFGILVPADLNAHHIVDAHREMVLKLMWAIIAHSCMTKLLQGGQVEQEIQSVLRSNKARRKVQGLRPSTPPSQGSPGPELDPEASPEHVLKSLLFRWCKAVCSSFGLVLTDFTSSFADGKALCYLVHYYHPGVLRLDEILPTSNDEEVALTFEQSLTNERANSTMVAKRATELGGIPKMLPLMDTTSPPDERAMLLCLSYLCSRLMESSQEIFATILIQACYRRYRGKILLEQKETAAWTIFQIWEQYRGRYFASQQRRFSAAVTILEDFVMAHAPALKRMKATRLEREHCQAAAQNIQRCFRGFQGRCDFLKVWERYRSATMIQSSFRRFQTQLDFLEVLLERDSAICIQTLWRACNCRRTFTETMDATIAIQSVVRGHVVRRQVLQQHVAANTIQYAWWTWVDFADSQVAALLIQSLWRGIQVRKQFEVTLLEEEAAIAIQTIWRGFCQHTVFITSREFTVAIQCVARGFLTRKEFPLRRYQKAAVVLQRKWRSFSAQVHFHLDLMDIVCVQSLGRGKCAKREAFNRRAAIKTLQGAFRCALARRALEEAMIERGIEIQHEEASIICQRAIRVWRSKNELIFRKTVHNGARSIQSVWRGSIQRSAFLEKLSATLMIQNVFRGFIARLQWACMVEEAVRIQRQWRIFAWVSLQHRRATVIQAHRRSLVAQRDYELARASAICVQKYWRRAMAVGQFGQNRCAAIMLQAIWRRYSARLNYNLDILEVVISQSIGRRFLAQNLASTRRDSIQILQNFTRRFAAVRRLGDLRERNEAYLERGRSATLLQSIVRRSNAQKLRMRKAEAVVLVQSLYRSWINRSRFVVMRVSATKMQALCRGALQRDSHTLMIAHASDIQRVWRGFSAYIKYALDYGDVILVQSIIRRHIAIRIANIRRQSIVSLQSAIRRARARALCKRLMLQNKRARCYAAAAILIQSLYKGSIVRQQLCWQRCQATLIQSVYRARIARLIFEMDRMDIVISQAAVRRWISTSESQRRSHAVNSIQATARECLTRWRLRKVRAEKEALLLQTSASSSIQTLYRGYLARRNLTALHGMATTIQSSFRGHYVCVLYQVYIMDVSIVQSLARRWLTLHKLKRADQSAVLLQSMVRRVRSRRQVAHVRSRNDAMNRQLMATVWIQSIWRGFLSRKISSRHSAARKVQKTWRCFATHVDYLVQQISILRLQATSRKFLTRTSYLKARSGTIKLQAHVRGMTQRNNHLFLSMAASIIQATIRGHSRRMAFLVMKHASIRIQSLARGCFARDELEVSHFAATEIQRVWRGFAQLCDYVVSLEAIIRLQSFFRMQVVMGDVRELQLSLHIERLFYNKKASFIQQHYRAHMLEKQLAKAAFKIQTLCRAYILRRQATVLSRGVARLQAAFRARKVRRKRSKRIALLARRVVVANRTARENPKLRIGYKTRHALLVLQSSKSLAEIMDAVKSLETSTRLSQLCCVLFTEANAARILLDLIRSCNRSVPHVELVQCILLTLDNVAQYPQLVPSFADRKSAEIFLDKMQMFRDKDGIFCLSVSLLGRISECNADVEDFCAMHEHLKRLKALHQLSLRRAKTSGIPRRVVQKQNRMRRRDNFDRIVAIKSLGMLAELFTHRNSEGSKTPNLSDKRQYFTF